MSETLRHSASAARSANTKAERVDRQWLIATGIFLLFSSLAVRVLSSYGFDPAAQPELRSVVILILLLSASGLALLNLLRRIPRVPSDPRLLLLVLLLGFAMRIVHWGAHPILEDDYLRYLWDGAVTAAGLDPYAAAPASADTQRLLRSIHTEYATPEQARAWALADLADRAPGLVDRASYRYLTTIYPPVAQAAFALAHWIAPYSLDAWRFVLLCAELIGLATLLNLLRQVGTNPLWCLLYWWNPVAVMQIAHAGHMDALLVPVLLIAVGTMARQQPYRAAVAITVAAGLKLWPLLLLPSILSASEKRGRNAGALLFGATASLLLLWPQLRHVSAGESGLNAFATEWVRNAFVYPWLLHALRLTGITGDGIARLCVVVAVAGIFVSFAFCGTASRLKQWAVRWASGIAALFLLAPTGYPWYFVWFLPLLCLWRFPPLLMLSALLPLYYGLFVLDAHLKDDTTLHGLLAIQFLPVWIGLGYAWLRGRWRRAAIADPSRSP